MELSVDLVGKICEWYLFWVIVKYVIGIILLVIFRIGFFILFLKYKVGKFLIRFMVYDNLWWLGCDIV